MATKKPVVLVLSSDNRLVTRLKEADKDGNFTFQSILCYGIDEFDRVVSRFNNLRSDGVLLAVVTEVHLRQQNSRDGLILTRYLTANNLADPTRIIAVCSNKEALRDARRTAGASHTLHHEVEQDPSALLITLLSTFPLPRAFAAK